MNIEAAHIGFFIALIIVAFITGNLFCGKVCPFGYLQDLLYKIPFFVKIKTFKADKYLRLIKYVFIAINAVVLPILAFLGIYQMSQNGMRNSEMTGNNPIMIIYTVAFIVLTIIIQRPLCKYLCPGGAWFSIFNKISLYKYKTLAVNCTECGVCTKKCKMDIIPYKNNNSIDCIRCGNCKKVCNHNAIISGFKT